MIRWTSLTPQAMLLSYMAEASLVDLNKIKDFPLFKGLEQSTFRGALVGAICRQLKHREYLYRCGDMADTFSIVMEGALKLIRHSPRGEDIIMHFAVQGDVVGALLMNHREGATYPISVKAMGATTVALIPKSTFIRYWRENATLQGNLNAVLYRRMTNIQDDKTMSTSPLRVRIANLLLRHLDQEAEDVSQPLALALTRQEIADALGVAVESVIRTMREWQINGIISRQGEKGAELINVEKLLSTLES